jgi:hypothetical protein
VNEEKEVPRSDSGADDPKREEPKPEIIKLGNQAMPVNDEGLHAVEMLGRCSKCQVTGWIDYPKKIIPGADIDKLLAGRPVKCFCGGCRAMAEFVPMKYRIKHLPDQIQKLQDSFKKGLIR